MATRTDAPSKANHFIREWRKAKPLTQEKLAEMIGSTSSAISQLENGIINYTQPTLEAIARAVGCRPGDLLNRPPEQGAETPDARLRSAMLAYGVDASQLPRAIAIIKTFVAAEERLEQSQHGDRSQFSSHRREEAPSE